MNAEQKENFLKSALVAFGVIFCLVYPLGMLWPSGWVWHGGEGTYYLQMIAGVYATLGVFLIAASRNPGEPQSHFVHGLVECRSCGNHGSSGNG